MRKISSKYDIFTVQDKKQALEGNKTKITLEMTPWEREIKARRLKVYKMRMKKYIEKEK